MNKRDIFLPSLSTLIISGMMVFYSCAHQNRAQDELDAVNEEEAGVQQAETEVKENVETASNDLDMAQMGMDDSASSTVENAENKVEEAKTEAKQEVAASTENVDDSDLSMLGMDSVPTTTADNNELPADPLADLDGAVTAKAEELKVTEAKPEPQLEARPSKPSHVRKSFAGVSFQKVPKIPAKPLVKNGVALNRFYFIRQGDTPKSVSEMIYGSQSRSSDLQKWNASTPWTPGHIVYYSSPVNPKDNQIGSFYRENGVEAEEYTVGKGDWISKIAYKKLGSPESWKEVAVINGMSRPDKIEVGQRIAIYPKDLSRFNGEQEVASTKPVHQPVLAQPSAPQLAPVQPQQPEIVHEPAAPQAPVAQVPPQHIPEEVQAASQPVQPIPVAEAPKPVSKPKAQSVDSSKLVEQNLPAAVILGGVLILSAAYLAVRRRKMAKQHAEEFDETPSSKSNRR